MKQLTISIFYLFIFCINAIAQNKCGYNMLFGDQGIHAQFNGDTNRPLIFQAFLPYPTIQQRNIHLGSSCISNSNNGRLLIACNGHTVYDSLGNIIENGDSLVPSKVYSFNAPLLASVTTQASLILPKGNLGLYYLFTPTKSDSSFVYINAYPYLGGRCDLLQYHIIDMNANAGSGKVIAKNIPLMQNAKLAQTGLQACKHANGVDWWLLKNGIGDANVIYRFLVTADTIIGPDSQYFAQPIFLVTGVNFRGQSAFSANGKKYAFACTRNTKLFMADFDRCTGLLNNPQIFTVPADSTTDPFYDNQGYMDSMAQGVAFSSNDSFIYVSNEYNIHQLELYNTNTATQWYNVQHGSDTSFQKFEFYSTLHRGIDNRIYIGKQSGISRSNSVIDYPNKKGVDCGFCRKCLRLDNGLYWTVAPANMPDFTLSADSSLCWPLASGKLLVVSGELKVYPNPANNIINIEGIFNQNDKLEIYNAIGQKVIEKNINPNCTKLQINIEALTSGLYVVKVKNGVVRFLKE
jgi:Secretion system C-terminal sorting domain